NRFFPFLVLAPIVLAGGVFAIVQAAGPKGDKWSDPKTWPDNKVPVAGDKVEIPTGKTVVLDVSPPALNGVTVNGKLTFADNADVELTTEWVMLHGELEIGTAERPHKRK